MIQGSAPCYNILETRLTIRNITDSTLDLWGQANYCAASSNISIPIYGILTPTATKSYELWHWSQAAQATNGLGKPVNNSAVHTGAVEVYAQLTITKLV